MNDDITTKEMKAVEAIWKLQKEMERITKRLPKEKRQEYYATVAIPLIYKTAEVFADTYNVTIIKKSDCIDFISNYNNVNYASVDL